MGTVTMVARTASPFAVVMALSVLAVSTSASDVANLRGSSRRAATAPPNCMPWCAANTKPWSEKCQLSFSPCNGCDVCQPPPPPPAGACIAMHGGGAGRTRVSVCGCDSSMLPISSCSEGGCKICMGGKEIYVNHFNDQVILLTDKAGPSATLGVDMCLGGEIVFSTYSYDPDHIGMQQWIGAWNAREEITIGSCKQTPTPTAPTATPSTPAPPTAAPAPTPPSQNCQPWCAANKNSWSQKCAWSENCNECNSCQTPAPTESPHCRSECYADTQPRKIKCGQQMGGDTAIAEKCNKCPECPLFPSSCAEASSLDNQPKVADYSHSGQSWADWADFFNPQAPGNLWSTDYCSGTQPTPALTTVPTTAPTLAPPTPAPAPWTLVHTDAECAVSYEGASRKSLSACQESCSTPYLTYHTGHWSQCLCHNQCRTVTSSPGSRVC